MSTPEPDFEPLGAAAAARLARAQDLVVAYLRRYHRFELDGWLADPGEQVLFVGNHGFGGLFDLNIAALMAVDRILAIKRPTTSLIHQLTWTLGLGPVVEPFFARPASRAAARQGFARGHHVLVLPGGDLDAFKAYRDRHRIMFNGRAGYAEIAIEAAVPIVPIVTYGAGNSLLVLNDGQRLARALGLDRHLRLKALPISLSVPWGLSVGLVGLLPYAPLPTQIRTRVLSPMRAEPDESAQAFARRVETAMQAALDDLAGN